MGIHSKFSDKRVDFWLAAGLFLAALAPRLLALEHFINADETKWLYRSAQFWLALLKGDWAGTEITMKPAVTTMLTGGLGIWLSQLTAGGGDFKALLAGIPQWQIKDLHLLTAARTPTALLAAALIPLIYGLLRRSSPRLTAFLGACFAGMSPYFIAQSRFLHHDALVTIFSIASLLLLIHFLQEGQSRTSLILSGIMAGFAFLTKSPILFLAPFTALVFLAFYFLRSREDRGTIFEWFKRFLIWGVASYLCFVIFYPAAWSQPVGEPFKVIKDAVLVAGGDEEGDYYSVGDLTPDLGIGYYPLYFAFRSAPLTIPGLILWLALRKKSERCTRLAADILLAFAVLYMAFMTLSMKRSDRYILPSITAAEIVAGFGFALLIQQQAKSKQIVAAGLGLFLFQAAILLPYAPYYSTYYNPLLGGPLTAPRWLKIGWGEGLDEAGRWLSGQADASASQVGVGYASTLGTFFPGHTGEIDDQGLDYVVLYLKQLQGGKPTTLVQKYYASQQPLKVIDLAGIDYARIYSGPAMRPSLVSQMGKKGATLPLPIAFREATPMLRLGEENRIEVLWLSRPESPPQETSLELQPVSILSKQGEDEDDDEGSRNMPPSLQAAVTAPGKLESRSDGLLVTEYSLPLPQDLAAGDYALTVDGRPLGKVSAALYSPPALQTTLKVHFGGQFDLLGYNLITDQGKNYLDLVWQAAPGTPADYTFFLQVIDDKGQRISGVDRPPAIPTHGWLRGQVVIDRWEMPDTKGLPSGEYHLLLGGYTPADMRRLTIANAQNQELGDALVLPIQVKVD